jgi:hypothetical protein
MTSARVSRFVIDSLRTEPREFQGHHEMHLSGSWHDETTQLPGDMLMVRGNQPQAVAALCLLDPESDDGLVTWNIFDSEVAAGKPFPVWRVADGPRASP